MPSVFMWDLGVELGFSWLTNTANSAMPYCHLSAIETAEGGLLPLFHSPEDFTHLGTQAHKVPYVWKKASYCDKGEHLSIMPWTGH